jgi:hypothetical protein
MKKNVLLLLFVIAGLFSSAQKESQEPYLTKSLGGETIKNIEAVTSGGNISVTGEKSNPRIEVFISANNNKNTLSKEEIKQRLDELYDLDVSVNGNKLNAIVKNKVKITDWKKSLTISFRIYVPETVSTDLTTSGGNINLDNLAGDQSFSTSGGNLNLSGLSGKLKGRTSGGNVNIKNSKDEMELTTSGGNITAGNCSGILKLTTSGGGLNLYELNGTTHASTSGGNVKGKNIQGELKAHTSGGNVSLDDLACSLESSTSGGNINVSFTALGKYIRLNNSAGNISLTVPKNKGMDLDLSGEISKTQLENFDGKIDDNMVKGKLNGGGVPVRVDASSGRVKIELK